MDFSNKVVIVTGASSGIGAACALKFAKLKSKLSLIGRNSENLNKVSRQCETQNGVKPLCIIADISKDKDLDVIINKTVQHHGKIDILINNAGISKFSNITDSDILDFDSVMATNVRGTYLLTKKAIPHIINTKGNIVNISSILSSKAVVNMAPYCMSKAAIDMFTKCVALEVAPEGVRVNCVNPGPVKTEIFKKAGIDEKGVELLFEDLKSAAPLKKITAADDVAELVAFLASETASCVTGASYVIDCGSALDVSVKSE